MSDTRIAWTQRVWNPTVGCSKVSAGCRNCYALRMATRLQSHPDARIAADYAGTVTRVLPSGRRGWSGKVNCLAHRLEDPVNWTKPSLVFVDSMSDLFHEDVPTSFIRQVFETMARCSHHTFQVLTKRAERMAHLLTYHPDEPMTCDSAEHHRLLTMMPLPNVWLGVSVENQAAADARIPLLLQTPAAVRWVSAEPLLGPLDLSRWLPIYQSSDSPRCPWSRSAGPRELHWVVVGGESGPGFRAMELDWARSVRDQCQAAGVALWFKQESGRFPGHNATLDGQEWRQLPEAGRGR